MFQFKLSKLSAYFFKLIHASTCRINHAIVDPPFIQCFNRAMDVSQQEQDVQSRVDTLVEHLATIRRNHEKTFAENKRLREVVRLAESELRKRREQIEKLQHEYQNLQTKRLEAKARVEHVLEKVNVMTAEANRNHP